MAQTFFEYNKNSFNSGFTWVVKLKSRNEEGMKIVDKKEIPSYVDCFAFLISYGK